MSSRIFIGVDLGTSIRRKSTGIAFLVEKNGHPMLLTPPVQIMSYDALIHSHLSQISGSFNEKYIGIDAPLSFPQHGTMRECEKRLRHHGIACFPSGADWVRNWVLKGIELKNWAEGELDARIIEVYPYAARRTLGMDVDIKKKSKKGRRIIQNELLDLITGLKDIIADTLLSDDELDAILSAYTAYLVGNDNAVTVDGADGIIYLPAKKGDHRIDEY